MVKKNETIYFYINELCILFVNISIVVHIDTNVNTNKYKSHAFNINCKVYIKLKIIKFQ